MPLDFERCWRAVVSRDTRFDGLFYSAVRTTGIYCRPSCPGAPRRENVTFYRSAAAAQAAGFRACKRCRPDASPGSPEWDIRTDVVGRAMRLIADGVVDRIGVGGLAAGLGYSARHLHRQMVAELGVGPRAVARAQRAHTARILLETTDIPVTGVAEAAGFSTLRQFNETIRDVYARTPTAIRSQAPGRVGDNAGCLTVKLAARAPFDGAGVLAFLAARAIPGLEEVTGNRYRRALTLPNGYALAELDVAADQVTARLYLDDPRDLTAAISRCRRLFDLDADPVAVWEVLRGNPLIAALARPGVRVPCHVDPAELLVRAALGEATDPERSARMAARLLAESGPVLGAPSGTVTHAFPGAAAILRACERSWPGAEEFRDRVRRICAGIRSGALDPSVNPHRWAEELRSGRYLAAADTDYVLLTGTKDPDVFLPEHPLTRAALGKNRISTEGLRPWRSYAQLSLWSLADSDPSARIA